MSLAPKQRPFDEPLEQGLLDIEAKTRTNLFAWRGQFSPQFVEAMLTSYASPGDVVLDPFAGSGTVLIEAAHLGHEVHGFEVNPAAVSLAKVYEFIQLPSNRRREALRRAEQVLSDIFPTGLPLFDANKSSAGQELTLSQLIAEIRRCKDRWVRTLLEALIVQLDIGNGHPDLARLWSKWAILRMVIGTLPFSKLPISMSLGDARHLGLTDDSVDFVLTSPPYINVFNYHHNYRASVEVLGWKPLVAARSEIGSNRKFRQNRFLTVVQYCIDMTFALSELGRVGRRSARFVFVVGRESNVHKTAFYNGAILRRLAEQVLGYRTALEQERAFRNKFGTTIKEDILHFVPGAAETVNPDSLVDDGRRVGVDILAEAKSRTPPDRLKYLDEALERSLEVQASQRFDPDAAKM